MLVCGVCKGKKIVDGHGGRPKICPKCNGTGNLDEEIVEGKENKKPKQVLNG